MDIRAPEASDLSRIHALLCANGWAHRVGDEAALSHLLAASRSLVAVEGNAIVGFARAVTDGMSNGYLSMVLVAPEYQRRGIGSRLVREMMGTDPAITWVLRASRPGARAFFAALGFTASADAMERNRQ